MNLVYETDECNRQVGKIVTHCLICDKEIPVSLYETMPKVCGECKNAILRLKEEQKRADGKAAIAVEQLYDRVSTPPKQVVGVEKLNGGMWAAIYEDEVYRPQYRTVGYIATDDGLKPIRFGGENGDKEN